MVHEILAMIRARRPIPIGYGLSTAMLRAYAYTVGLGRGYTAIGLYFLNWYTGL